MKYLMSLLASCRRAISADDASKSLTGDDASKSLTGGDSLAVVMKHRLQRRHCKTVHEPPR
jgi:hypothetical protein